MSNGKSFFGLAVLVMVAGLASAGLTRLTMGNNSPTVNNETASTPWEFEVWCGSEALEEQKLKTAGAEGWELISATVTRSESSPAAEIRLYFKRPAKR